MITTILTLPAADGAEAGALARESALAQLKGWSERWRAEVRDRFILNADEMMVVTGSETALGDLPAVVERRTHARVTRWALLARTGHSRVFGDAAQVVVFPPREAEPARLKVLGVRAGAEDLVVAQVGRAKLSDLRVGKLDHPALLWRLEREVATGDHWPATSEGKAEAMRVAASLAELGVGGPT